MRIDIELFFLENTQSKQDIKIYVIKDTSDFGIGSMTMDVIQRILLDKNLWLANTWDGVREIANKKSICSMSFIVKPYSAIKSFLVEEIGNLGIVKTVTIIESTRNEILS